MECFKLIEVSCEPLDWLRNCDTWLHHCFFQVYNQRPQFFVTILSSREYLSDFRNEHDPLVVLNFKFIHDYYWFMIMLIIIEALNAVVFLVFGVLAFLFRFETYKNDLKISATVAFVHLFEHQSFRSALHLFYFISIKFQ